MADVLGKKDIHEIIDDKTAEYYRFDFGEDYVKVDRKNHKYYLLTVNFEWTEYPKVWEWFWADDRIYEKIEIPNETMQES